MSRLHVRHILCPVDFSHASDEALATAAAMARERQAELRALHVMPPARDAGPAGLDSVDRQRVLGRLREMLEDSSIGTGRIGAAVAQGDPGINILRFACALPADLIVIGAAQAHRAERLSSPVTSVVASRSECPVLTVPHAGRAATAGVFTRIVCAIDPTPSSARVIEQAFLLASETGGRVTCVYVHGHNDDAACARDRHRAMLAAVPTDLIGLCEFELIVEKGVPAIELARVANDVNADLLVIGPPRRWTSLAHAVLSTSSWPVLIAHDLRPLRCGQGAPKEPLSLRASEFLARRSAEAPTS